MDTAMIQIIIATFIGFFIVLYIPHQNDESSFGRSIITSFAMSALVTFFNFGNIGIIVAAIVALLTLILIQKYEIISSVMALASASLLSYIINLGIQHYFQ